MNAKPGKCAASSQKCFGCTKTRLANLRKRKYCDGCWDFLSLHVSQERQRLEFWRIARTTAAERWGIRYHCPDKMDKHAAKIGEAWIIYNAELQLLNISLYLMQSFPWRKRILVVLPVSIWDEATYLDLILERSVSFFETSFAHEDWDLDASFVSESVYYSS